MFIDSMKSIEADAFDLYLEDNGVFHYCHGLIYIYGYKAGLETMQEIARRYSTKNRVPFEDLRGSFSYIIDDPKASRIAFTDNSHLRCLYYTEDAVSDSFLRLINDQKQRGKRLAFDDDSLCEIMTLGRTFFDKTPFKQILMCPFGKYVAIDEGRTRLLDKQIGDIEDRAQVESFEDFFNKLAYSISDLNVSQALTGGYDSRMVFILLMDKIKDHPFISGNNDDNMDYKVATKVAEAAGIKLERVLTSKPIVNDDLLKDLMITYDGIVPCMNEGMYRVAHFKKDRIQKGYDIALTGDGGVLHKDWEWMQDLPFYHRKKTNLGRFYEQRIKMGSNSYELGDKVKDSLQGQKERFVKQMGSYQKNTNTQSYDNLYFHVSGSRQIYYSSRNEGLLSYAPLNELDIVRYSYALPRRKRFFYNNMRATMTRANKKLARIPTDYGTTASSEFIYIFRDVFVQIKEYYVKAKRMLTRKYLHRNPEGIRAIDWSFEEELRELSLAKSAVSLAKQAGYISTDVDMDSMSLSTIERCIYLFMLGQWAL